MSELKDLPNIGPELEKKLIDAGIKTQEQLLEAGSKEAMLRIKAKHDVCLHMLYALEGAVQGVRKPCLSNYVKDELKAFYTEVLTK